MPRKHIVQRKLARHKTRCPPITVQGLGHRTGPDHESGELDQSSGPQVEVLCDSPDSLAAPIRSFE